MKTVGINTVTGEEYEIKVNPSTSVVGESHIYDANIQTDYGNILSGKPELSPPNLRFNRVGVAGVKGLLDEL